MKALLITCLLIIELSLNTLFSQPTYVIKALKQKFPSAKNITWAKDEDNYWEAKFLLGDRKTSALFTSDGHWQSSVQEIKLEDLGNDNVRTSIKRDFPDCEVLYINLHNCLFGTWYDVVIRCGTSTEVKSYGTEGWDWPPKISSAVTQLRYST